MSSENKKRKAKNSYCWHPEKWDENSKWKRVIFYRKKNRLKNKQEAREAYRNESCL